MVLQTLGVDIQMTTSGTKEAPVYDLSVNGKYRGERYGTQTGQIELQYDDWLDILEGVSDKIKFFLGNFPGNIISSFLDNTSVRYEEQVISWFLLESGRSEIGDKLLQAKIIRLRNIVKSENIDIFFRINIGELKQNENRSLDFIYDGQYISFTDEEFQLLSKFWKLHNGETFANIENLTSECSSVIYDIRLKISDWWAKINGL